MANVKLKKLLEATLDRKPLKEINFGSQNAFDDYIKQHDLRPDTKVTIRGKAMTVAQARKNSSEPTVNTKPNDMFGGDYAKDRGGEAPKVDAMATVNSIAAKTGLRAQAVAGWADENGVNLSKVSADIDSKKLKPMDFMTAVSGNPGNKYAKDIIAKYSQGGGEAPKAKEVSNDDIEKLTSYEDFTNFFKDNFDKFDEDDLPYIQDEMGALDYLESDYESGDIDKEELLVAYEELQDLLKRALSKKAPTTSNDTGDDTTNEPKVRPQSKVQDLVKNLSGKKYKEFAFDNDIDHRDPMEMQDFIQSLSDEEAEEILKKYGTNESTKLMSMIKR